MHVPEKLQLNKFRKVAIPRPKDILGRYGFKEMASQTYSGEADIPMTQSKLDAYAEAYEELKDQLPPPEMMSAD